MWTATAQVAKGVKILYKYIVRSTAARVSWEDRIPDRELSVEGPTLIVNDGTFNQITRPATFLALTPPSGEPSQPSSRQLRPAGGAFGGGMASAKQQQLQRGDGAMEMQGGEAAAALKAEVSRYQQLVDQVAELQRQRAIELAEIKMLSDTIKGSSTEVNDGPDAAVAAEAFVKVQEKLAALEKTRSRVHEQAKMSADALEKMKVEAAQIEARKAAVEAELQREIGRKRQLKDALQQTNEALTIARSSAERISQVHQQNAESKEELTARLLEQVRPIAQATARKHTRVGLVRTFCLSFPVPLHQTLAPHR